MGELDPNDWNFKTPYVDINRVGERCHIMS